MKDVINQFIWGFQQHFRSSVGYEVKEILTQTGLQTNGKSKVMLVAIATREDLPYAICIEPEDGPLQSEDLAKINGRTQEILTSDPESRVFHTNARVHEFRTRQLFLRCRANAIGEAIEDSGKFEGLKFFVSNSAPVSGYDVHTCIGLPCDTLGSVPSFNNPKKNDYHGRHTEESLVQAIINSCLFRADKALYLPNPGEGLQVLGDRTDIVRGSAERFIQGVNSVLSPSFTDLFSLANEIATLTYERSGASGNLVITEPDNLTNKLKFRFQNPVRLSETRSVRKILELTDETSALLADGEYVYGLGDCNSAPDVAEITIEGSARWSLSIDNTTLMRVTHEHATLPQQILDKEIFADIAERVLGEVEIDRVWDIFQCALGKKHGTTIVVSGDPEAEVKRLANEALAIKPDYLHREDVARLGRVDGAIILGTDGRCYAFGVILDGQATSSGDRSRGARFNSSVRYQQTSQIGTLVIVISDDGTVDLIPTLMPRVRRQDVEESVVAFCEYSGIEDNDGEEWARRLRLVEGCRFYLNQGQCDRVNEAHDKEMESRRALGGLTIVGYHMQPDPNMDNSYFWND